MLKENKANTPVNTTTSSRFSAQGSLKAAAVFWVSVALVGQWAFAMYILTVYARNLLLASPEAVNQAGLITGFVAGDTSGNTILFAHVIPAALLSLSGIFQLMPWFRRRLPLFHRWNGRFFLTLGLIGALTGLYLTWGRGSRLSDIGAIGITLNGLLIPVAIGFAWMYARKKRWQNHARWATHAFLLINGVWFLRLFLMGWFLINQGPNGNNATLDGPVDLLFSFGCYLIPMAMAEAYFWAKRQPNDGARWLVSGVLFTGGLLTVLGIGAAAMMMWLPSMNATL